ncbi:hypothetical protein D3C80_1706590 [compost metagenome]
MPDLFERVQYRCDMKRLTGRFIARLQAVQHVEPCVLDYQLTQAHRLIYMRNEEIAATGRVKRGGNALCTQSVCISLYNTCNDGAGCMCLQKPIIIE